MIYIMVKGGSSDSQSVRDEIYRMDTETNNWVKVGRMKTARYSHGLSTIEFSKISHFCE